MDPTILDAVYAIAHNKQYIEDAYEKYKDALKLQHRFCIVGHGRAGKDTVAGILANKLKYRLQGSTSYAVLPLICYTLHGNLDIETQKKCYESRHNDRDFWYKYCNLLRTIDPTMLIKLVLASTDFIIGTRSTTEFLYSLEVFKPTMVLWISKKDVPKDPTLEFDWPFVSCMCENKGINAKIIKNDGSLTELSNKITQLVKSKIRKTV